MLLGYSYFEWKSYCYTTRFPLEFENLSLIFREAKRERDGLAVYPAVVLFSYSF